jgi:hypothetical protein
MLDYMIEVAVKVETGEKLSKDVKDEIVYLKNELIDAIENVLKSADDDNGEDVEVYTVPLHSGRVVRVPEGSFIEYYSANKQTTGDINSSANEAFKAF